MVTRSEGLLYDIGQGASALDAQAARDRLDGYAVVSGLGVSVATGLDLDVAAGTATVGETSGSVDTVSLGSTTTVSLGAADSTHPRKDVIYIDTSGTVQVESGVAEAAEPSGNTRFNTYVPEPPFPSTEGTILAEVWVPAGASSLQSDDVRDRRQPADVVGDSGVFGSVSTDAQYTESRVAEVIVREEGGTWIADGPTGEIDSNTDPGIVVNSALSNSDDVAVVGNQGNMTVSTAITHTTGGKSLVIGSGTTLQSDGTTDPIKLAGNNIYFRCNTIDANGHSYCVQDGGIGPSHIEIVRLINASSAAWHGDTTATGSRSNAHIEIDFIVCNGTTTTPKGVHYPSGLPKWEGYYWEIGVILHPTDIGVDYTGTEEQRYHHMVVDVDAASGGASRLIKTDEEDQAFDVDGYIQTTDAYDVRLGSTAAGTVVRALSEAPESPLRVQRETPFANVKHGYDPYATGLERRDQSQGLIDSLDGTVQDTTGTGAVTLDAGNGYVEQSTGTTSGSFANFRRLGGINTGQLADFGSRADFSATVEFSATTNQEGWLIWGDRGGPGVGFNVVNGDIFGWAHNGTSETQTASLQTITAGASYHLNFHHNPGAAAWFWVGDDPGSASSASLAAGDIPDSNQTASANRMVTFDWTNTAAEDKDMRWTDYDMQIRKR